jgi:hypothetical protein
MKKYKMKVVLQVEEIGSYGMPVPIDVEFKENVPEGVNPTEYLRSRVSEEFKRASVFAKFEWKKGDEEEGVI